VPALASTSRLVQGHTSATRCRRNDTAPAQTLQAWTPQAEVAADGQQGAAGIEPTIQKNKASQAVAEGNHCIRKVKTVRQLRAGESANASRWSLCTTGSSEQGKVDGEGAGARFNEPFGSGPHKCNTL
jgi:hypothetical protein